MKILATSFVKRSYGGCMYDHNKCDGGTTFAECCNIFVMTIQNIKIGGTHLVKYNPNRNMNNITAMVYDKLFKELIDKMSD